MNPARKHVVGLVAAVALSLASVGSRAADSPAGLEIADPEVANTPVLTWPRVFQPDGHEVAMHQPQLDEWEAHARITGKAAVAVTPKGADKPVYGAAYLKADTQTDVPNRTVLFSNFEITDVRFPNADDQTAARCRQIVTSIEPVRKTMLVSLDQVIAAVERSSRQADVGVNLEPPPIFRSEEPAILVIFLGEPKLEQVKDTGLLFAANTNWDVFFDIASSAYYLLNGEGWLTTKDVTKGPWVAATSLPTGLKKLPDDENWQDVRKNVPGKPAKVVPKVFVSTTPAELILTQGTPQFKPIPGTKLLQVGNTESDLFMLAGDGGARYYFLVAGRWFEASGLDGPWKAATNDLPGEFAKIPEDSPCAHVLSSVPGTPDADAAVLLASVPHKATVNRKDVTITVVYDGKPKFVPIQETTVSYAVNTPDAVFRVEGRYYCCHEGIWFVAAAPAGPWTVATSVPEAIYAIPSTHPLYNVTYVYVYDSTPTQVTVGYTSGYTGQYVAGGLLMFGLGYALGHHDDWDDHWHYASFHYHSHYFSYGCGARFDYYAGGYVRGASARLYGPYGGAGRWAAYNPATGTYARGAYRYGPQGGAYARAAYNPYTGRQAGRVTASGAYGSWGRSVVSGSEGWAQFGHRSGPGGTVGGFRTSEGAAGVVGEGRRGQTGGVAKDKHGDAYVGRDGNIYRRTDGGGWQKHTGDGWNDLAHVQPRGPTATPRTTTARPSTRPSVTPQPSTRPSVTPRPSTRPSVTPRPSARPSVPQRSNAQQLQRDYQARSLGQQRASGFQRSRSSTARTGGFRGGGRRR